MVGRSLPMLITAVGALWLVVCLAHPHRPRRRDELAELVYARRVAQRDRLALLAIVATAVLAVMLTLGALALVSERGG